MRLVGDQVKVHNLCYCMRPYSCLWPGLPQEAMLIEFPILPPEATSMSVVQASGRGHVDVKWEFLVSLETQLCHVMFFLKTVL